MPLARRGGYLLRVNIVVVVTGGISETLQTTPLLRTLRAGDPSAHITLLCPETAEVVAEGIPPVDQVVACRALGGRTVADAVWRVWWELRRRRVDAVLLCSGAAGLRLAAFLAGVPERLGPSGGVTSVLLSERSPDEPGENLAAAWLRLAGLAGIRQELHAPWYEPSPETLREADRVIHSTGFADGRLLVALAPGNGFSEAPGDGATTWDGERYALLANQLAERHGAGIIFLGTAADRPDIERTMLDLRAHAIDLSGQLELHVIAAVLARIDLVVGGDTPLLHMAAAVGTPAVGLFAATDGRRRGPYGSDHRIIQGLPVVRADGTNPPDQPPAMDRIRVEDVLASIEASL